MPDGIYSYRGWRPLPKQEGKLYSTGVGRRMLLVPGGICLGVIMLFAALSGLLARRKRRGSDDAG